MAPFKEENYLIIAPGSQHTLCFFGRNQESLALPTFKIPTRVLYEPEQETFKPCPADVSAGATVIYPIVKGKIVNVDALKYFIKVIVKSLLKDSENLVSSNLIALTLIAGVGFSKKHCELLTNFVFEELEIGGFNIIPTSLSASFAYGSLQNSLIIDIGYEKTDISAITDYQNLKHLNITVPNGGATINESLKPLLPTLSAEQIEDLKLSAIFEVLSEEDAKNSFFGIDALADDSKNPEDEGVLDVAAIVTSDKDPRELLKEKVAKSAGSASNGKASDKPNSELEKNSFTDHEGNVIEIGKERFQGAKELIESISHSVRTVTDQIPDLHKRQELFDNVILVGGTSKIKGFKEALLMQLLKDHLILIRVKHEEHSKAESAFRNETGPASVNVTGGNNLNKQLLGSHNEIYNVSQVPKTIKYAKFPDYFPIWKKANNFEDLGFLGAEILTKQIFGTGHGNNYGETLFLNKESYLSSGPVGIWDVAL